jgi:hypothetical protein
MSAFRGHEAGMDRSAFERLRIAAESATGGSSRDTIQRLSSAAVDFTSLLSASDFPDGHLRERFELICASFGQADASGAFPAIVTMFEVERELLCKDIAALFVACTLLPGVAHV